MSYSARTWPRNAGSGGDKIVCGGIAVLNSFFTLQVRNASRFTSSAGTVRRVSRDGLPTST
jgi:hypothetical protein